jgi:ATP-binding cassette subfamily B protein/subfamily B ATP-binding cassette protein MsbA
MSFFTALGLMFEPLRKLSNIAGQIQAGLASLERLNAVLGMKATIRPPKDAKPMPKGDLVFENVTFSYDSTPVLRGLSFVAEEGKTTALVGASGAGKSTVFGLMTRLIEADGGVVSIGGTSIAEIEMGQLRGGIAVVGQETALFDETIAANIRLGRLDADDAAIEAAARDANVAEFTDTMPDGLASRVGPRGSSLSGGQRQRVAIARALLKAAPVLLLDEPTSALDAQSERLVQSALERLAVGRTTVVIAHRLSTIRAADKIVVMEAGRVIEEGTHDELMSGGGAYARLAALQATGGD